MTSDDRPDGLESGTLDNGVRYTIWTDPRDTVATAQVWVDAGTADEDDGQSGIAHMLEHMMFRGTETIPDGRFDERAEELGLYVNAATWLDYTFYTGTGPAGAIGPLLALEGDRFANLTVAPEAFGPERDVVANERRQVVDAVPESLLGERFHTALFDGSSYAWPTIGWADDIDAYDADAVLAFYRTRYAPDRLHVVVVGNVDPRTIEAEIRRGFGRIPPGSRSRSRRTLATGSERRATHRLPISSTRLLLGWRAPRRSSPDWPAWIVLDELFAAAESSRLTRRLEYDDRSVLDIGSSLYPLRDPSALELSCTLRRGVEPDEALRAVDEEIRRIVDDGVPDDELAGAVARVRTSQASALVDTAGRAESLGESWALTGDPLAGLQLVDRVAAVRADAVRAAAAALLEQDPVVHIAEPS